MRQKRKIVVTCDFGYGVGSRVKELLLCLEQGAHKKRKPPSQYLFAVLCPVSRYEPVKYSETRLFFFIQGGVLFGEHGSAGFGLSRALIKEIIDSLPSEID